MTTYRQSSRSATEVRYTDPLAFFNTVTVKASVQPKKAGTQTVYNANSAINLQRTVTLPLPEGCADNCTTRDQEKLSVRFSLSGSTQSKEEVKKSIVAFRGLLTKFEDDLVSGFIPLGETVDISWE